MAAPLMVVRSLTYAHNTPSGYSRVPRVTWQHDAAHNDTRRASTRYTSFNS